MKKQREEITIRDLANIFIPKLWLIVLVAVVFGAVVAVNTVFFTEDTYTSYSDTYIYRGADSHASIDEKDEDAMVEVSEIVLSSNTFLQKVIAAIPDEDLSASFLRRAITFTSLGNGFFRISVTTNNPDLSYKIADAITDLFIAEIYTRIPDALSFLAFEDPIKATAPNSKGTIKNTVIAALLGAILTALIIWIISVFDVVIHDKKKIEDNFDIPILGVIPRQEIKIDVEAENED